jgi:hypothetical protein
MEAGKGMALREDVKTTTLKIGSKGNFPVTVPFFDSR